MPQFHESLPSTGGKARSFTLDSVALILGGGGAAGQAWEIGIIAGLAEAGLDMTEAADLVVGTSAGQNQERTPSLPMATVFERMRAISAAATSAADLQRAMGAFGLEGNPHPRRPCRFRPRQAGSDPRDVPLTIARAGRLAAATRVLQLREA